MAVAVLGTAGSTSATDAPETVSFSYSASPGSDRIAVVIAYENRDGGGTADTTPTATYDGNDLGSPHVSLQGDGSAKWLSMFTATDAQIGSGSVTVAADFSGGSGTFSSNGKALAVVVFSGADQSTPVGGTDTDVASSGNSPSASITSPAATSFIVDCLAAWSESDPPAEQANQTGQTTEQPQAQLYIYTSTQDGADGGAMDWTKTANWEYVLGALEILEVSAAGGLPGSPLGRKSLLRGLVG